MVHSVKWTTSSTGNWEKGRKAGGKPGASGPLARSETGEKARKPGESREPVDHFKEWTTSSARNREKGGKPGKSREPVVHSDEWTTSSARNWEKGGKPGKSREPVVHFEEWTTSWAGNREKGPKTEGKLAPLESSEIGPKARKRCEPVPH